MAIPTILIIEHFLTQISEVWYMLTTTEDKIFLRLQTSLQEDFCPTFHSPSPHHTAKLTPNSKY